VPSTHPSTTGIPEIPRLTFDHQHLESGLDVRFLVLQIRWGIFRVGASCDDSLVACHPSAHFRPEASYCLPFLTNTHFRLAASFHLTPSTPLHTRDCVPIKDCLWSDAPLKGECHVVQPTCLFGDSMQGIQSIDIGLHLRSLICLHTCNTSLAKRSYPPLTTVHLLMTRD